MRQIGDWFVGPIDGGVKRRAITRNTQGECFSVVQPVGGGSCVVLKFKVPMDVYERMLLANGELDSADADKFEVVEAIEVPAGLADALLA